jgi:hypothetical protein
LIEQALKTLGAFSLTNLSVYYSVVAHFKLATIHHTHMRKAVVMLVDGHVVRVQFAQACHTPTSCKLSFDVRFAMFTRLVMVTTQCIGLGTQEQTPCDVYRTEYRCAQFMSVQNG